MNQNRVWELLEIEPTDSKKDIRRAYSECLKKYHPEEEPKKFRMIKDAYEQIMEGLKNSQSYEYTDFEDFSVGIAEAEDIQKEDAIKKSQDSLLNELSKIMDETVYQDSQSEKMKQKIIALFENPLTREDEEAWATLFLEWDFLDVQLKSGFAESLKKFLEEQEYIPDAVLIELMNAYDLEVQWDYLVLLDVWEDGEMITLLKGAKRIIASLWNEQEQEKREYLQEEHLCRQENSYRRGYFHEYLNIRYLFESRLLIEGQEKLWEYSLWLGKPENMAIWDGEGDSEEEMEGRKDYLPMLYAYLVNRFEIPEFVCSYFYSEYELYFLDGCKWENWYVPLRNEVIKRYPELEKKQFSLLGQKFGGQGLSIQEQKSLMALVSPLIWEGKQEHKKAYQKIMKLLQEKQRKGDYSYHFYMFSYCVNKIEKNKLKDSGLEYVIKIVVYLKSYLFALPHMEYPEEMRSCFFETLWKFTHYYLEAGRKQKIEFYGEDEFLLHCESSTLPAVFSVWELENMPHGICSHCGKSLKEISFNAGESRQRKREILEEWDLYQVAKSLTKKSKKNFAIYKMISKLYKYRTCEHCGEKETFLNAYMNWWYENTEWKRPDKKLLEWLFQKVQEIEFGYEGNSQRIKYCKVIIDYLQESKEWDKKCAADYFKKMHYAYQYSSQYDEKEKERAYYLGKTKDMLEQVFAEEELTDEERIYYSSMKADAILEGILTSGLTFEEAEKEFDFVVECYDSMYGVGNMKSILANEKRAFSLAYNHHRKYDPYRAIDILKSQLELIQKNHPEEREEISKIQESIACISRDKVKDYPQAVTYFEQYLNYIEDTYGKEHEFSIGEREIFEEICKLAGVL